jgi:hypothetical protein
MAVWKQSVCGYDVKINDVDHFPAHCHVDLGRRRVRVNLWSLEIMDPPPHELPGGLRRGLKNLQMELLEAWERVRKVPPGSSPGVW